MRYSENIMDRKAQLTAVIDGIINNDEVAMKAAFAPYIQAKSKEILGYSRDPEVPAIELPETPVTENLILTKLQESLAALADSPVKLQGNRVIVGGKEVGTLQSDPTDFESGINFIENGGQFSKEFNTVEELFNFLFDRYTK